MTVTLTKEDSNWTEIISRDADGSLLSSADGNGHQYYYYIHQAVEYNTDPETERSIDLDGTNILLVSKDNMQTPLTVTNKLENEIPVSIHIDKIDETTRDKTTQTKLPKAKFKLFKLTVPEGGGTGSYTVYPDAETSEQETNTDGTLSFENLPSGQYRIDETKQPDGYVSEQEMRIYFTIQGGEVLWTDSTGALIEEQTMVRYRPSDKTFSVGNTPGSALPNSGGPGTTWIYLIGAILLLGCGTILVARRRTRRA